MPIMVANKGLYIVLIALVMLAAGCGKETQCRVPIGDAACSIDPNSPLYPGINNCDGYEYIVGGYNGVVVVRTGFNTFAAYERTCPNDSARLEMAQGYGNIVLECKQCGSRFNTFDDGAPLEGSRTYCYLYKYGTHYDGQLLYISNY